MGEKKNAAKGTNWLTSAAKGFTTLPTMKISISLPPDVFAALKKAARDDRRSISNMAAVIIAKEIKKAP